MCHTQTIRSVDRPERRVDGQWPGRGRDREDSQWKGNAMPRYLTAPSRFLVIISTFVVALVLLLASSVMAAGPEPATVDYRVMPGDSLWSIAEEIAPDEDTRGVISEIRDINDLETSLLLPGQILVVPVG